MTTSSERARERRELRAARRGDRDGSGPTLDERAPARFPGATAKFGLLGEVLMTGLLVTLVAVPVVTLPIALAAGIRHLRRFVRADGSPQSAFWSDVRRGLPGGALLGLGVVVLTGLFALDIDLAASGALPGGPVIAVVGWAGLVALAIAVLTAAGAWTPETGWRGAIGAVPALVRRDVPGALYLAATAAFVVVVTWALVPLVIPALGCAALAVVAVPERPRRHAG